MGEIISHTPIWVFILFGVLVFFGLKQSKARHVPERMVIALPVAMLVLSLLGVISGFGVTLLTIVFWMVGVVTALMFNWLFRLSKRAEYDVANHAFHLKGSWVPLLLMMIIFFTKYTVAVLQVQQHALSTEPIFMLVVCALYGVLSGSFVVRATAVWQSKRYALKALKAAKTAAA